MLLSGWALDLEDLYGDRLWGERARFGLRDFLYEAPAGDRAVLLYAVGEVGLNKQVGRLAVLTGKAAPRVRRAGAGLYWFEGCPGEPVAFDADGRRAWVWEYAEEPGGRLAARERALDLETAAPGAFRAPR